MVLRKIHILSPSHREEINAIRGKEDYTLCRLHIADNQKLSA